MNTEFGKDYTALSNQTYNSLDDFNKIVAGRIKEYLFNEFYTKAEKSLIIVALIGILQKEIYNINRTVEEQELLK